MSSVTLHIGDVFDVMRLFAPHSVDLIVTSPPFLALRSYLPADHPDKHREIGSEATPADFLDTLLALTAECRRVLAPHGSLCVELGDTYSGSSGGAGGDYGDGGLRDGQPTFKQTNPGRSVRYQADGYARGISARARQDEIAKCGPGWPLAKSLTGIPTLYTWSLAYGRNLLTGEPSPAGQWRIRNLLVWARPNPPVGALGDKFRPATSYITVACTGPRRWFDLDAVRTSYSNMLSSGIPAPRARYADRRMPSERRGEQREHAGRGEDKSFGASIASNPIGAPPLDWHTDGDDGPTGDRLWIMPTQPYSGAHYATYPLELPRRLIDAMCPREVCRECGKARERIVGPTEYRPSSNPNTHRKNANGVDSRANGCKTSPDGNRDTLAIRDGNAYNPTLGWSDCGHNNYRPGLVCDPFLGSGTTAVAAAQLGRDCIGIDLDDRNTGLVNQRLREKVHIVDTNYVADREATTEQGLSPGSGWHRGADKGDRNTPHLYRQLPETATATTSSATEIVWHCDAPLPDQHTQLEGQTNLFDHLDPDIVDIDTKERL